MIRICKNKTSKKAAFTLLEMVLVIAIMMIMSVYLYATFKTVVHSHAKHFNDKQEFVKYY